jgi:hypothetical protein
VSARLSLEGLAIDALWCRSLTAQSSTSGQVADFAMNRVSSRCALGIATIHANDTRAMLDRFCQLVEEVLPAAPRKIVAQTIHVCVHMQRDASRASGRSISAIDRVLGFDERSGWQLTPLVTE